MEDSTAVTGAIQGKTPYSGTSGSLYQQMANNASTPIAGLLAQFHNFLESVHAKKAKNIAMHYEPERWASIVGAMDANFDASSMDLNDIADLEFDVAIREGISTPTYRAAIRDDLKEFLVAGFITFDDFLALSDMPYADKLQQRLQARENSNGAREQPDVANIA